MVDTVTESTTFEFASEAELARHRDILAKRLAGDVLQLIGRKLDMQITVDEKQIEGQELFDRGEKAIQACRLLQQHLISAEELVRVCASKVVKTKKRKKYTRRRSQNR